MLKNKNIRPGLTGTQIIAISFAAMIAAGTFLLSLPAASRSGEASSVLDCFFTATSASCVTGLSVYDTYTHWSLFGQLVILLLIQAGGLGLMTLFTIASIFLKKRISIHERKMLMESAGTMRMSGVVLLLKKIFKGTLLFEGLGALLLSFRFCGEFGLKKGLYFAVFHSVSAFCNAGFDLFGAKGSPSLTSYSNDPLVMLTVSFLIIIGGLGFHVWNDVQKKRFKFSEYELHTKIVLSSSALLLLLGMAWFFFAEKNYSMAGMSFGERLLSSFFASVTPRTAGFYGINYSLASKASLLVSMFLMFIGGSPCSTAGGIKTTTFAVMLFAVLSNAKADNDVVVYKRRISESVMKQAGSIATVYLLAVFAAGVALCFAENFSTEAVFFEVISAAGTVGMSLGITSELCAFSKIVLSVLMFGGRIGMLSLTVLFRYNTKPAPVRRPEEKILVG